MCDLLEVAMKNEQPITISMGAREFCEIVDYRVQDALERYKQELERERQQQDNGDLLKPKEAMAVLGVTEATLWRYVKSGLVTKRQVGGKVYYSRKELSKLMEG